MTLAFSRLRLSPHPALVDGIPGGITGGLILALSGWQESGDGRGRVFGILLADVATSRLSGDFVVPDTGSLREDLERHAADLAKDLCDPDTLALVRATIDAPLAPLCYRAVFTDRAPTAEWARTLVAPLLP